MLEPQAPAIGAFSYIKLSLTHHLTVTSIAHLDVLIHSILHPHPNLPYTLQKDTSNYYSPYSKYNLPIFS